MPTRVFTCDPNNFQPQVLDEAARILASGGLVGFPTETVYGIAANADDPAAVARLEALKSRPSEKPFSVHIADYEQVVDLVEHLPPGTSTLMATFWPGPLTLVLPAQGGAVGIRFPSHPVAQELIRRSGVKVIAPSANPAGRDPAIDATQVLEYFEGQIDAVIDGGPVTIREASTVVQIDENGVPRVLREGIISALSIHRALYGKRILFVCTGNSCRSPMAAALARHHLAERREIRADELPAHGIHIESAGIAAFEGGAASQNAIVAMAERGIDLTPHRSRSVRREMIDGTDLIITLGQGHRDQLLHWDPDLADRVIVISETGISDPIGGDIETYRRCAAEIERGLQARCLDRIETL